MQKIMSVRCMLSSSRTNRLIMSLRRGLRQLSVISLKMAFAEIGVEIIFKGENVNEVAVLNYIDEKVFIERVGEAYLDNLRKRIGDEVVGVDPQYFRPTEVDLLIGDATKARTRLGWEPKFDLAALIEDMMLNDIKLMKKESYLRKGGYEILNYFE